MSDAAQASAVDLFPTDAPFDVVQRSFLNGLLRGRLGRTTQAPTNSQQQTPLGIFYASQTGTAAALAKQLKKLAAHHGFSAAVAELDSITPAQLADSAHLLIVAATSGEGEAPDNAQSFFRLLMADDAPALPASLHYSVCGLGDASYAHFNKVAQDLDSRLAELGATRSIPPVLCDADYDEDYERWCESAFASDAFASAAGASIEPATDAVEEPTDVYTKKRPFLATLLDCHCLSDAASQKKVNHIELSLASGCDQLSFDVGDALGLWPLNDMADVEAVLQLARVSGRAVVQTKNGAMPLQQALQRVFDLTTMAKSAGELWQVPLAADDQLLDGLAKLTEPLPPQRLVDALRPLQPRLYSISSSPLKHPGEVHLTVAEVHYEHQGRSRKGVASTFLGSRLEPGSTLGVYVQKATHFALPDDDTPLIMIGPGTGIAPFRSFLEEREVRAAKGWNWLFFGDQHETADYLYKQQISEWRANGLLNRLSLAWSRDSAQKVYVQHLIVKEGKEFFSWLQQGAAIYVCGDASRMAADVEAAIIQVIGEQGAMTPDAAHAYLDALRRTHRYQRDVY